MGTDDRIVGQLVRDRSMHPLRSLDYVQAQEGSVGLDLGEQRLERVEEHRAGGALTLKMQLWPHIELEGSTADARIQEIRIEVPRDDWIAVVSAGADESINLLEIRYHLAYADRYRSSLAELRRAREAVDRGDFDSAVIQARKAVTLMERAVESATGDNLVTVLTDRIDEEHARLYGGIVVRAKGMGNMTAHVPAAREYTRVEALFAIRLATISLEVVAGLLAE
ncbi:MAG: hypothetical protein F4Y74_10835 [Gemmatimonadales bacterium]|nr:hypothetical protein [Gemmatimonadales bacterium]MYG20691.1 hypothetical protein [Gemmatimonadales bacterium]